MIQHKKLLFGSVVKNIYIVIMLNNDLNRNCDTVTLVRGGKGRRILCICVHVCCVHVCVCVCWFERLPLTSAALCVVLWGVQRCAQH